MIKQMLKLAGVKNEKEFLKKFPTEQSFLNAHPEASMLLSSKSMNYYEDGGEMMMAGPEQQGGGMPPQEQGMPGEQDVAAQQEQIIQFIMQLLQQNIPPPEIIQQLVQAGLPEEQAAQLVNAVMQQVQAQMQGPSPEEQMMMQGEQQVPAEQMAQEPPTDQPMMRRGGKYKKGGSTYSGTYSGGVYYAGGGPAFIPDYGMMAMGGSYDNPGFRALPSEVQNKIMSASRAMYGGSFDEGGSTDICPEGYAWDGELEKCVKLPSDFKPNNQTDDEGVGEIVPPGTPSPQVGEGSRLSAGFGLANKGYNFNYDFGINPKTKKDITHNVTLGLPNLFKKDKGLTLTGEYAPRRSWNLGIQSPNIPLFGGKLNLNARAGKTYAQVPELRAPQSVVPNTPSRMSYNAGLDYSKKIGKTGPTATVRVGYTQQYGGLTKFVGGGEFGGAMDQQDQMGEQEAMMQQLMMQIGQALQQGAQPEEIIPQLVQMGMSEQEAMQFIQMTAQQMGAGGGQGAVMPMEVGMYGGSYAKGGMLKQYKKGGEYDLNESEIQDLVNKGYKIQYV